MVDIELKVADIQIMKAAEYICELRNVKLSQGGICISAEKCGSGFYIDYEDKKAIIGYNQRCEFYRALSMLIGYMEAGCTHLHMNQKLTVEMCSVLWDCSRYGVPKVETVKKFVARLAMMGYNSLMLYTEDVFELDDYEYFGYMRGKYSVDELKQINRICEDFGMELIPCIQALGHLSTTLCWNYANDIRDTENILLIDEPKTYEFIEAIFKTWRSVTESKKIHIGMDEASSVGLGQFLKKNGMQNRFDIMCRHINKVCEIAKRYDFEPMMWSDVFFKIGSKTGDYYDVNSNLPDDISEKIPDNISMIFWDYYHDDCEIYKRLLNAHKKFDCDVIYAGAALTTSGFTVDYEKSFVTADSGLKACEAENIKNTICCLWQDDGAETNVFLALPCLQIFAEYAYRQKIEKNDICDSFRLCTGLNANDFFAFGLNAMPGATDTKAVSKQILYQDILIDIFDKNFEAYDLPMWYEEVLNRLNNIKDMGEFNDFLEFFRIFTRLLIKKSHIGVNIRKAYENDDRVKLNEYADTLLDIEKLYFEFHEKNKEIWDKYNKPFGYELTEERIGGMVFRIRSAEKKIRDYAEGKISKIDELEEKLLWYGGEESAGKFVPYNLFRKMRIYQRQDFV